MIPVGLQSNGMLIVVDFSWWLNLAFRVGGIEGMAPIVVGKVADLLRGTTPSHLAVALDSIGPTWRHEAYDGYKGNREPKPEEFYAVSNALIEIVKLHSIPLLYAEGWEADDVLATAARRGREDGLGVVLLTADKDIAQCVGDGVWTWDGKSDLRGPDEVADKFGVAPSQIADYLAILGDNADAIRGVPGLGPRAAAAILAACGSLEGALSVYVAEPDAAEIKRLERTTGKARKAGAPHEDDEAQLATLRSQRQLRKWLVTLQDYADDVRAALRLTTLDRHAPIAWDARTLPVGGYDVERLRRAYRSMGFSSLADEVQWFPKDAAAAA